ncbi:MAG TPA: hypothetical protein VF883_09970 [Thermoanaerobaculia bacterium]|jgi:hypothetical protein
MRRLAPLFLAIALFATIGILWIVTDRRASERVYDELSSANTSTAGVSQAAAYLARRGKSAMLVRPVSRTPLEANAVIFRLTHELPLFFDPADLDDKTIGPPKPKERALLNDAEDAFVRRGGRVVIGAHMGALPAATPTTKNAEKVFPIWPGIDKLTVAETSSAFTELRPRMHAVFAAGDRVVLARERIGDGDLFVLSWPEVFQNAHLSKANHLALLSALAGKRPVYFDEVPHGILGDDGALALMAEWNLGPFLAMLCVVAALVFWRGARRVGPPEDDHRETRSDAVDLVGSLAALYGDVTTQHESLKLYHDALTRTVAHTSGLRGDALRNRVDELTGGQRTLAAINEGFMKMQAHRRTGS